MYTHTDLIEERQSLLRQLRQYRKNLLRLQEQQAMYESSNVPLHLLNNIDDLQEKITRIEARLQEIDAQLESLPPTPTPQSPIPNPQSPIPTPQYGPGPALPEERPVQPTVFISYSHKDEAEKEKLISHLGVLQSDGLIDVWVDDRLDPGSDWAADIDQAINRARVAILLITANFLTSDILQTEVPRLLARRQYEELIVFPVIARPCAWRKVEWLVKMKVRPKHEEPVWREGGYYVDEELAAIAEEVAEIIEQARQSAPAAPRPGPATQPPPASSPGRVSEGQPVGPGSPAPDSAAAISSPGSPISDRELIPLLQEALERHSLVLFIGADLPRQVTGLPARADLARLLARRKGLDETLSLADLAQRVSQAGNRFEFIDFLRHELDTLGRSPQPFHQQVAALVKAHQVETLITTAYDNLLELAFQQAGVGINRVVRGSDINFINPDRPTLIKLYGDVLQPDTLVVTDQDHTNLLRDRDKEPLLEEVKRAFRRNTVLFLGYNLADIDFRFLFDQIAESRFARTAYALWPGLPEADVQMWRDRGIAILEVDPLLVLMAL